MLLEQVTDPATGTARADVVEQWFETRDGRAAELEALDRAVDQARELVDRAELRADALERLLAGAGAIAYDVYGDDRPAEPAPPTSGRLLPVDPLARESHLHPLPAEPAPAGPDSGPSSEGPESEEAPPARPTVVQPVGREPDAQDLGERETDAVRTLQASASAEPSTASSEPERGAGGSVGDPVRTGALDAASADQLMLDALGRAERPVTRPELERETGLLRARARGALERLVELGKVRQLSEPVVGPSGGRPTFPYELVGDPSSRRPVPRRARPVARSANDVSEADLPGPATAAAKAGAGGNGSASTPVLSARVRRAIERSADQPAPRRPEPVDEMQSRMHERVLTYLQGADDPRSARDVATSLVANVRDVGEALGWLTRQGKLTRLAEGSYAAVVDG